DIRTEALGPVLDARRRAWAQQGRGRRQDMGQDHPQSRTGGKAGHQGLVGNPRMVLIRGCFSSYAEWLVSISIVVSFGLALSGDRVVTGLDDQRGTDHLYGGGAPRQAPTGGAGATARGTYWPPAAHAGRRRPPPPAAN